MSKPDLLYYDDNFQPFAAFNYAILLEGYEELGPLVSSFTIPDRTMGHVRVEFMGKSKAWPARRISSSNEITLQILLNRKTQTYQQLLAIQESFNESSTGNVIGETFVARCILYEDTGSEAMLVTYNDAWLRDIGEIQLDSSSENELLSVSAVIMYSTVSFEFIAFSETAINAANNIAAINNMDSPVQFGGVSDRYGVFPGLNFSRALPGNEPLNVVNEIRSQLASLLNINIGQLDSIRDTLNVVRGAADGITSKANALRNAALSIKNDALGTVLGSLKPPVSSTVESVRSSVQSVNSAINSVKSASTASITKSLMSKFKL